MSTAVFLHRLEELSQFPKCHDWGAKVQATCEAIWEHFNAKHDADEHYPHLLERYISFLQDPDVFMLAQLSVPELRGGEETKQSLQHHPVRATIITSVSKLIDKTRAIINDDLAHYDTPVYAAEKQAYYNADLYRTKLFLRRNKDFNEEERREILEWLEACPGAVKRGVDGDMAEAQEALKSSGME